MRTTARRQPARAFTFIEVLAALLFLAILIPTIMGALSISNRVSIVSERSTIAAELAENEMTEMLLNDAWATGAQTTGDFGPNWPGYRWEMTESPWQGDSMSNMTELKVEVIFSVQGREHRVGVTTLVNQPGTLEPPSS